MATKTIQLTTPLVTHEGPVSAIELREPKARDFFTLGEPYSWVRPEGGQPVPVMIPETMLAYVERCMVKPGAEMLAQVSLADALRLEDAIADFFGDARRAAFPVSATSSSSTSESSPRPNAAS